MALTIGQLIKQSRLNSGLTQEELGELVGVKKSAVAKWENGRVLKLEQAKEISGWRQYPSTCEAIFQNVLDAGMFDRYSAMQLGEIAAMLKKVYDKGVAYGREHPEY